MSLKRILLLTVFAGAIFASCQGPEGPIGPSGKDGDKGAQGETGSKGETGTANVIYSAWTQPVTNWTPSTIDNLQKYSFTMNAPSLSSTILSSGVVLVYTRLASENGQVRQLPYTFYGGFTKSHYDFALSANTVRVWYTSLEPYGTLVPSGGEFRYVIIPGGQAARFASAELKSMSYNDIKTRFNIPD